MTTKKLKQREKKLRAELKSIEEKLNTDFEKKKYPAFKKKYEGKYFKTSNSYGGDERWWLYTWVTEIKPNDIYRIHNGVNCSCTVFSFQTTPSKNVEIEQDRHTYVNLLGQEITKQEFEAAWDEMMVGVKNILIGAK